MGSLQETLLLPDDLDDGLSLLQFLGSARQVSLVPTPALFAPGRGGDWFNMVHVETCAARKLRSFRALQRVFLLFLWWRSVLDRMLSRDLRL